YIEHGLIREAHPVRLWYRGPMFRYDRPQSGRYRQFNQFGIEVIGEADPLIDAEVLLMTTQLFQRLGIPISIQINSNGHAECRAKFIKVFQEYAKSKKSMLCEDCRRRLPKNPLRIIDCKNESCQTVASAGPQIVDHLCEDCRTHFTRVLEYCDDVNIPYVLNPRIVRGLDYYTKTTFEVWAEGDAETAQTALGGGGRYDSLIQELGGRNTPAIGAAFGIERMVSRILDEKRIPENRPDIFVAQLGEKAKRRCLLLIQQLTSVGLTAISALTKNNLKDQLSIASKRRVRFVLVLGQKEIMDETIMIRDMDSGVQELIDYRKVVEEMKKRVQASNIKVQEIQSPAPTSSPADI
ncbi:MAG TPA: histidine--tRNA ligase, partial [Patescibacteria group bacterium]|nr:histidine--tRNA ligase [Patescibacteria group bacterium]